MTPAEIVQLVRDLKAMGVRSFKGQGIEFEATGAPETPVVSRGATYIEGLGAVDPDLFGGEQ
jgi:hypothetical protein